MQPNIIDVNHSVYLQAQDQKAEHWAKHGEPGSLNQRNGGAHWGYLHRLLKQSASDGRGFVAGQSISIADIVLFDITDLYLRVYENEMRSNVRILLDCSQPGVVLCMVVRSPAPHYVCVRSDTMHKYGRHGVGSCVVVCCWLILWVAEPVECCMPWCRIDLYSCPVSKCRPSQLEHSAERCAVPGGGCASRCNRRVQGNQGVHCQWRTVREGQQ